MLRLFVVLLSLSSLAMGGLLFHEATYDVNSAVAATTVVPKSADKKEVESQSLPNAETAPLQDYKVTLARPLFSPERSPQKEQKQNTDSTTKTGLKAVGPADKIKLSAIIITPDVKEAMFAKERGHDVVRVREGDTFGEWTVSSIEEDRVVITSGESRRELLLRVYPPPDSPAKRSTQRHVTRPTNPIVLAPVSQMESPPGIKSSPRYADPVSLKR